MKMTLKYPGLIFGIIIILISFLFFGRHQSAYEILSIVGWVIALTFFGMILLGRHSFKSKIITSFFFTLCIVIEQLMQPVLVDTSYRIFIRENTQALTEINQILSTKAGDIMILNGEIKDDSSILTQADKQTLLNNEKKLDVYLISKSNDEIYYGLWGFLDVRLGITYWTGKSDPNPNLRHLTGYWYH